MTSVKQSHRTNLLNRRQWDSYHDQNWLQKEARRLAKAACRLNAGYEEYLGRFWYFKKCGWIREMRTARSKAVSYRKRRDRCVARLKRFGFEIDFNKENNSVLTQWG